jgi:hypothetical protein
MKPPGKGGRKVNMKKLIMAGTLMAFLSVTAAPLSAAPDQPQTTTQNQKKKKHSKKSKGAKQTSADSSTPEK